MVPAEAIQQEQSDYGAHDGDDNHDECSAVVQGETRINHARRRDVEPSGKLSGALSAGCVLRHIVGAEQHIKLVREGLFTHTPAYIFTHTYNHTTPSLLGGGMLLVVAAAALLGVEVGRHPSTRDDGAGPTIRASPLLAMRGGVQPALVEGAATSTPVSVDRPAVTPHGMALRVERKRTPKLKRRKKRPAHFDLQDAASATLGVAALGAAGLMSENIMAVVPGKVKDFAWITFGSAVSSLIFLILRLSNAERAATVSKLLAAVVGAKPSRKGEMPSSLPALAVTAALGGVAGLQSLPNAAS